MFISKIFQSEIEEEFQYNDILVCLFYELLELELNRINIKADGI